jgi:hypothetical protein
MPQSCCGQFGREKKSLPFSGNPTVILVFPAYTPVTNDYTMWPPGLIRVKNYYNDDVCAVRPSSQQFVDQVEHGYALDHCSQEK